MKENWIKIADRSSELRAMVGDKEMDELSTILNKYRSLLSQTKSVVIGLLESSEIQKENCQEMVDLIKVFARNKYAFNVQEEMQYEDCIKTLGEWIDESDLCKLIKSWIEIMKVLEVICSVHFCVFVLCNSRNCLYSKNMTHGKRSKGEQRKVLWHL